MKAFFDTSALIPAFLATDARHAASHGWLARALSGEVKGILGLGTAAETYRVLSNHPRIPRTDTATLATAMDLLLDGPFTVVETGLADARSVLRDLLRREMRGKIVFDALLLHAARKARADVILTYDLEDFRRLAPDLASRIREP